MVVDESVSLEEDAMTKKSRVIRFFSILVLFPLLLIGPAEAAAKNNGGSAIYLPLVMR